MKRQLSFSELEASLKHNLPKKLKRTLSECDHKTLDLEGLLYELSTEDLFTILTSLPNYFPQLETLKIKGISLPLTAEHPFKRSLYFPSQLKTLYFYGNQFGAPAVDIHWEELVRLTKLNLAGTRLGALPHSFGHLIQLEDLNLTDNQLQSLPSFLENFTLLKKLSLAKNQLKSLDNTLGKLNQLITLNLSENNLSQLPESLGELTRLVKLNLSDNFSLSNLPDSLGKLILLENLNLAGNMLESLPNTWGNLTRLKKLNLAKNQLKSLDNILGNFPLLTRLNLSRNELNHLPDSLGELKQLITLDVAENFLTRLPEGLETLTQLTKLDVSYNKLSSLPGSLGTLTNLISLNIGNNRWKAGHSPKREDTFSSRHEQFLLLRLNTPLMPSFLGNLIHLTYLNLSSNRLTTLPESLGKLAQLTELDVSCNQLSFLPDSLGTLTKLITLNASSNRIDENVPPPGTDPLSVSEPLAPEFLGELINLTNLDLGENQLIKLPESLSNLTRLKYLSLDSNHFTALPKSLSHLTLLNRLQLECSLKLTYLPICTIALPDSMQLFLGGDFEEDMNITFPPADLIENLSEDSYSFKPIKDFLRKVFQDFAFSLPEMKALKSLLSLTHVSKHFYQVIKGYIIDEIHSETLSTTRANPLFETTITQEAPPPIMQLPNELLEKIVLTASKIPYSLHGTFISALREVDRMPSSWQEKTSFTKAITFLERTAPTWEETIRQRYQQREELANQR